MKEILEQLGAEPGIRLAALVMEDGVPVAVHGADPLADANAECEAGDSDALAALAAGWVLEVCDAVAPLAWDRPRRMVLRGAHGTLVLRRAHTAWLLVLLAEGLRVEDVTLAMDGTAARLERLVRARTSPPPPALPANKSRNESDEASTSFSSAEQELP